MQKIFLSDSEVGITVERVTVPDQCLLNFNLHKNHLENLLKCRFKSSEIQGRARDCISSRFPVGAEASGWWVTSSSERYTVQTLSLPLLSFLPVPTPGHGAAEEPPPLAPSRPAAATRLPGLLGSASPSDLASRC